MVDVESQIDQIWDVEQEILNVIDKVCSDNQLKYSLAYGTLIGAVRHGGFIPWDDDVDIVMPRDDYEKLLALWEESSPVGYILQNIRTNSDFTQTFSKICKDKTTFLQEEEEREKSYHKGIFVDIFPLDRVAPNGLWKSLQYIACAINLLYTRGYPSGSKGVIGFVENLLIQLPSGLKRSIQRKSENLICHWNDCDELMLFGPSTIASAKNYYEPNLFEKMGKINFCGKQYMCVRNFDRFLRSDYGDYMKLPPENERVWKHHPIIIDFEHNYEELEQHSNA